MVSDILYLGVTELDRVLVVRRKPQPIKNKYSSATPDRADLFLQPTKGAFGVDFCFDKYLQRPSGVGYMVFESTVELRGGNLWYVSRTEGLGFVGPLVPGTGQLTVTGGALYFLMDPGSI